MAADPAPFSGLIQARCLPGLAALVDKAAQARGMTHSQYVRQATRTALQLDGFDPATVSAPRDAGALYDLQEGQRRYAWVEAGAIKSMGYFETGPEDWVPVVHEDSEPFDIATHWRLAPVPRIEPDRVVMVYPVIVKSMEFA